MSKKLNKFALIGLSAAILIASVEPSFAADSSVFGTVKAKGIELFKDVRDVIFILGGFGLVGLALGAIFGRVNWKWFGGLAFGLVILAVASAAIGYLTGDTATTADFADTLT
ncbi:MAG: TrbC/VirB2 family protein [Alphaproteobacteria bacterium]|nr:TrbC/VirB2 family protein [Alphaproteobacteria bacterium]